MTTRPRRASQRDANQGETMSWKAPWWQQVRITVSWPFRRLAARWRYWRTGDCGMACGYVTPYGWVPEAGCPIHDREAL